MKPFSHVRLFVTPWTLAYHASQSIGFSRILDYSRILEWVAISFSRGSSQFRERTQTQVLSLGREDPLEKEVATHSSILAWRIPWTEEPGGLQSIESQRVRHD